MVRKISACYSSIAKETMIIFNSILCDENSRETENNLWMECMGKESTTSYEFCCVLTGECKER